jgi:hypothetical protein
MSSSSSSLSSQDLAVVAEMNRIESSNDPVDIATLAYIWGYPLISAKRLTDFATNPNVPPAPNRGKITVMKIDKIQN